MGLAVNASAVPRAEAGSAAWRSAVHAQQVAPVDHADFYGLAGELVDTLSTIRSLARLLARQVAGYAGGVPAGRRVYDDTRTVDPRVRMETAVRELENLAQSAGWATADANRFWSAIGHIGVEDTDPT